MIGINSATREVPRSIHLLAGQISEIAQVSSQKVKGATTQINLTVADAFEKKAVITSSFADGNAKTSLISLNPSSFFRNIIATVDHAKGEVAISSKPRLMPGFIANKKIMAVLEQLKVNLDSLKPLPDGKNVLVHATGTLA